MLEMYLKDGIHHDDDIVVLTITFEDGEEQILLETDFDSFSEYELEDYTYTEDISDGRDLIDVMEWNDELNCFEYNEFKLYVVGFKIV